MGDEERQSKYRSSCHSTIHQPSDFSRLDCRTCIAELLLGSWYVQTPSPAGSASSHISPSL